jgi:hypothetical protein
LVGNAKGETPA